MPGYSDVLLKDQQKYLGKSRSAHNVVSLWRPRMEERDRMEMSARGRAVREALFAAAAEMDAAKERERKQLVDQIDNMVINDNREVRSILLGAKRKAAAGRIGSENAKRKVTVINPDRSSVVYRDFPPFAQPARIAEFFDRRYRPVRRILAASFIWIFSSSGVAFGVLRFRHIVSTAAEEPLLAM